MSVASPPFAPSPSPERGHNLSPSTIRTTRPQASRTDTDRILSYYHSPDADSGETFPLYDQDGPRNQRAPHRLRFESPSRASRAFEPSAVSSGEDVLDKRPTASSSVPRHRYHTLSEGGSDRRRMAIVQTTIQLEPAEKRRKDIDVARDQFSHSHTELRSRRGHEGSLSLVAPPDASPSVYMHLTPPLSSDSQTLPTSVSNPDRTQPAENRHTDSGRGHHVRYASEAASPASAFSYKSPREVSIVGTSLDAFAQPPQLLTPNTQLQPPLFQSPQSRSPSPAPSNTSGLSNAQSRPSSTPLLPPEMGQPILTPDIGQSKNIGDPVAAPIVVTLTPTQTQWSGLLSPTKSSLTTFSPNDPSSYVHYQPGVHATAGPLPPPPRAVFDIDPSTPPPPRPPRVRSPSPRGSRKRGDVESVKQALQIPVVPPGISPAFTEKSSVGSLKADEDNSEAKSPSSDGQGSQTEFSTDSLPTEEEDITVKHIREGAHPPSSTSHLELRSPSPSSVASTEPPEPPPKPHVDELKTHSQSMHDLVADVRQAIDEVGIVSAADVPPPDIVEPPRATEQGHPALDLRALDYSPRPAIERSRFSSDDDSSRGPCMEVIREYPSQEHISAPKERYVQLEEAKGASSPPKRMKPTLAGLRRFSSLSRSSSASKNRLSTGSLSSHSSRTPSPPPLPRQTMYQPRPRAKIRTAWPSAMNCQDVLVKKSAGERAAGYAMKINELWMCETGLAEWMSEIQHKNARPSQSHGSTPSARWPEQRRHVSRSSMASEATFPKRADAYTATDLLPRITDDPSPPTAPPVLPYPSLALSPKRSTTVSASPKSLKISLSSNGKTGGGFFSSLGRRTSIRKDKLSVAIPTSPTSDRSLLQKQPSIKPQASPTVARVINIINTPAVPGGPRAAPHRIRRSQTIMLPPSSSPPPGSSMHRNSSVVRRPSVFGLTASEPVIRMESDEFVRQVDKLADLLPQADRAVLAGYLRRAGQDILAIGQYLEDERNGTIRSD